MIICLIEYSYFAIKYYFESFWIALTMVLRIMHGIIGAQCRRMTGNSEQNKARNCGQNYLSPSCKAGRQKSLL